MPHDFNPVYAARPESIFPAMSRLARAHGAINLGQGFPDQDGPPEMLALAAKAIIDGPNQYAPVEGTPELRAALARDNKRFYGLDIDPATEVMVTTGATIALAAIFQAMLTPDDEVVLFSPFYESYAPQIEATGAGLRIVDLLAHGGRIDAGALESAITTRTKMIVINTPHNPLGRVMSAAELEIVAAAAARHDLIVVCDEVYEHLVFDGRRHVPLMTLPGMRERTLRIGSAGKTFSVTGFRIGYVTGAAPLIAAAMKAHQFLDYTSPTALQTAVAAALAYGDDYYDRFRADLEEKRDVLAAGLKRAGFAVLPCEGAYFLTVDIRSVGRSDDAAFCREITERARVAAVPISAFYHPTQTDAPRHFARFCFAKRHEVLEEASARLAACFSGEP